MLFSLVWVLAGITAWCVASLAVALLVGPMVRRTARASPDGRTVSTVTGSIPQVSPLSRAA